MRLADSVGRGMKRFLIFLLLGPLLGFLVFLLRNAFAGKMVGGIRSLHRNAAAYKRPPPSTSSDSKFWYCWRNSSGRVFVARWDN